VVLLVLLLDLAFPHVPLVTTWLALVSKGGGKLELDLEIGNHGNEALFIWGLGAPDLAGHKVRELGGGLSNEALVRNIQSQVSIMIIILFLCNVLLEVVIRYDELSVKELGNWVVDSGSSGKNLGVVDIEIGIDEVNVPIHKSGIDG
jgi:hypothetical protein